jgi:hypothetical protein
MNVSIISVKEPQSARTDLKLNALDHKIEKVLLRAQVLELRLQLP